MRVVTLNVNGIRSAAKKGFFNWVSAQKVDVVCLQETKAWGQEVHIQLAGYRPYFCDAVKKGYSGVAIYSRKASNRVITGLGWSSADTEGRYIQLDFPQLSVASLYMPSGTTGATRQAVKFQFMEAYQQVLKRQRRQRREYIICGDWNIAHRAIDLKNWRANQKHSGFLPEERRWLDAVFQQLGYVDAFRETNSSPEQYTWWSNRGRAWEKNVGWRIDYQVVTPGLKHRIISSQIYKDQRFSDHAPLLVDYQLEY